LVLDVKVEENKETPDLLSLPIRFVCGISHARLNYSTIPAVNLGVLYFRIFLKNIPPIYRNGGSISFPSAHHGFDTQYLSKYTILIPY
jgi:hypothetical protein